MEKAKLIKFAINQTINHYMQKVSLCTDLNLYKPSLVMVAITSSCNLRCKQCNWWKCKSLKELSTEEWKKIIVNLKNWLGPFFLSFTGGEPLLRKDIIELIEFASKLGIVTSLSTNGTLISKEMADRLVSSGLNRLAVSLDGINPETHDSIRGKGVFKKVISNIEYIAKNRKDLKIGIATILWDKNLDEIINLIKWEKNKNLHGTLQPLILNPHLYTGIKEYGSEWYKKSKLWPKNVGKVSKVIDDIILMKKRGYTINNSIKQLELMKEYFKDPNKTFQNLSCMASIGTYFILPEGSVPSCLYFFTQPIGNLKKRSAEDIWLSKKAADLRKRIRKCKRSCILSNCYFNENLKNKIYIFKKLYKG